MEEAAQGRGRVTIQELSTCGPWWFSGHGGIWLKVGLDGLGAFSNLNNSIIHPKLHLLFFFNQLLFFSLPCPMSVLLFPFIGYLFILLETLDIVMNFIWPSRLLGLIQTFLLVLELGWIWAVLSFLSLSITPFPISQAEATP